MNSKIKGIIVGGVFVAALGSMLVVLKLTGADQNTTDKNNSAATVTSADTSVQLVDTEKSNIAKITVKNTNCSYTLEQSGKDDSGDPAFDLTELNGIKQNTTLKSAMANVACGLEAANTAEKNAADFTKYGFDKPQATFTIQFADSTPARTFLIGDVTPEENTSYLHEEGSNDVYTVSNTKMTYYTGKMQQFISLSLVETPSDNDWPTYVRQTVTRKNLDYDVVFENDDTEAGDDGDPTMVSAQVMTSPIFAYLNITNSTAVTHGIWGLTATEAITPFPTEKDFAKYGLDDPFCTVKQITGGTDYVLKIGDVIYTKDEDGNDTTTPESYYCYLDADGADTIFTIAATSLPWTTFQPEDVITGMMTYNYIYNVSTIDFDDNGAKQTIVLNADKPDQTIAPVLNGKDVDSDLCKTFYQFLMNCPTTEIYYQEPTGEKFMTIAINLTNGGGDVMEFYNDTNRRAIVKLNGKTSFRIPTTYLDKLMENLQNLADGKTIDETY